jgi:small subunit ribosomal protein S2
MERLPKAMFVVDTQKEETAVKEARRLSIPVVGLIDTNSNPDYVDYPIPGNDDATKSIRLVATFIADSVLEGRKRFLSYLSESKVGIKGEGAAAASDVLAEEEVKVKETEGIVETEQPPEEETKPLKKGVRRSPEDKSRIKRKA